MMVTIGIFILAKNWCLWVHTGENLAKIDSNPDDKN